MAKVVGVGGWVLRFQEERRLGAAVGDEAVRAPGVSIQRTDGEGNVVFSKEAKGRSEERMGCVSVVGFVVADRADRLAVVARGVCPPEGATRCDGVVSLNEQVRVGGLFACGGGKLCVGGC